tara:strand:- start:1309 stop:2058 length:750 start_codon:yes stop_codon:yes gene_type:complete
MKILAVVLARLSSKRLPGKALMPILGVPMIELLIRRLSLSKKINQIVIAIPKNEKNKKLNIYLRKNKHQVFQGTEKNVLKRFYKAAKLYNADLVVRITGDSPLIDANIIDSLINKLIKNKKDYIVSNNPATFPDGVDAEVMTFKAIEKCYNLAKSNYDKEHVTPYIRNSGKFKILYHQYKEDYSNQRWCIDEKNDFKVVKKIFEHFKPRVNFGWLEIIKLTKRKPKIFEINKNVRIKNEYKKALFIKKN